MPKYSAFDVYAKSRLRLARELLENAERLVFVQNSDEFAFALEGALEILVGRDNVQVGLDGFWNGWIEGMKGSGNGKA
jgi:hypothetical protein